MTTATETDEGHTPDPDNADAAGNGHLLTGQEGDAAVDSAEVEAAMMAGWERAGGTKLKEDDSITDVEPKTKKVEGETGGDDVTTSSTGTGATTGDDDQLAQPTGTSGNGQGDEDPVVPGLGMTASQVKAQLARLESVEKTAQSLAGRFGHLKQMVEGAGKGKPITKEQLGKVSSEFGEEFAVALADDLNAAGFGGGATVDAAAIQAVVREQVEAARELDRRGFEKKLVLRAHKDADDYFAVPDVDSSGQPKLDATGKPVWKQGKHHAEFRQFIGTLPDERQQELATNGWDSDVIGRALDDFKAHKGKVVKEQATQQRRTERAVTPTGSRGAVQPPVIDPVMQGWNNVRGREPARAGGRGR